MSLKHHKVERESYFMKNIITIALLAMATPVLADGFVCETQSGYNVKVYNHTQAAEGTRSAAIMIVSDPSIASPNKTVATFSDTKSTLKSDELLFTAKVDLRVAESNRKGENVFGTKLGFIKTIKLGVDFSYSNPIAHGELTKGYLLVTKRDGSEIVENVTCERYLKN